MRSVGRFTSVALGMSLMYLFDPQMGRRRRARLQDKFIHLQRRSFHALEVALRDLANRWGGFWWEVLAVVRRETVAETQLAARVRTKLGRHVSRPRDIEVSVSNGHVILQGPLPDDELPDLLRAVATVRGVKKIENQLHVEPGVHQQHRPSRRTWTPATRLVAGTAGVAMMARCAQRPTPLNIVLGTLGFGMVAEALGNPVAQRKPAGAIEAGSQNPM